MWRIDVSNTGQGYAWFAYDDEGNHLTSADWPGYIVTEDAALVEALREIEVSKVKKTRSDYGSGAYYTYG